MVRDLAAELRELPPKERWEAIDRILRDLAIIFDEEFAPVKKDPERSAGEFGAN